MIFQQHTVAPGGAVYAINAAAIFRYKFLVLALHLEAGSSHSRSARGRRSKPLRLCGRGTGVRGKRSSGTTCAGGPCGKEILRPARRPGGPDLNWNHWLMKAVDTFDTTRKARFATYASRCIENAILTRANAGRRIGTISTALGVVDVLFRVYREGGPVDFILR